jgi:hypothetical protein
MTSTIEKNILLKQYEALHQIAKLGTQRTNIPEEHFQLFSRQLQEKIWKTIASGALEKRSFLSKKGLESLLEGRLLFLIPSPENGINPISSVFSCPHLVFYLYTFIQQKNYTNYQLVNKKFYGHCRISMQNHLDTKDKWNTTATLAWPTLKSYLTHCNMESILQNHPHLKEIVLYNPDNRRLQKILTKMGPLFKAHCPDFEKITLLGADAHKHNSLYYPRTFLLTTAGLKNIFTYCPQVRHLTFTPASYLTVPKNSSITHLIKLSLFTTEPYKTFQIYCQKLEELDFGAEENSFRHGYSSVSDADLNLFTLQNLKNFILSRQELVSDDAIRSFVKRHPKLERLNLTGCTQITDTCIEELKESHPGLEIIRSKEPV